VAVLAAELGHQATAVVLQITDTETFQQLARSAKDSQEVQA
jgi:hypothetical protein